jgi:hypothetical protein
MNQPAARSAQRHGAPRVSPLSAATLLLLVTMVLASSPAAPKAAFVHPLDPRPVPTRTLTAEIESEWASIHRQTRAEEKQSAAAWWRKLVAPAIPAADPGHLSALTLEHTLACRIRAALLDLPPPRILT